MGDDKDPEEKPSFFDSDDESSSSWPPADNYETESNELNDSSAQSFFENEDFENAFSDSKEESPSQGIEIDDDLSDLLGGDDDAVPGLDQPATESFEEAVPGLDQPADEAVPGLDQPATENFDDNTSNIADSDDFLDQLIDNIDEKNNINNMRIIDDEADEEDETPSVIFDSEPDPITDAEVNLNQQETDASYEEEVSNEVDMNSITSENEFTEAVIDDDPIIEDEPISEEPARADFDLDDLIEVDNSSSNVEEEKIDEDLLATSSAGATGMAFADPEGFQNDFSSEESSFDSQPSYNAEDYAASDFVEFVDDEEDTDLKPFRTFTKINLADELAEENEEEEEGGILAGMNRNVLIILGIIILSLGYFLFTTFFQRDIETRSRRKRRPPRKEKILSRAQQVLTPVWEISDQENKNPDLDNKYAKSLVKITGRENPFAMPQSVIDALKRRADLELLSKKKPNTYKRSAYRATLLGVLTSEGSTIALINMQEASFDVIEGTNKNKILKIATKSMDKAKNNTLEMSRGGFIGPWEIVSISEPTGAFSDARVTVEFQGTQKVLSMGKSEDLGIFDKAGQIDDLEQIEEDEDDFDDDF